MRLEIVKFESNPAGRRFGDTFSVKEDGEFWKTSNGSRRAWSTEKACRDAVKVNLLCRRPVLDSSLNFDMIPLTIST